MGVDLLAACQGPVTVTAGQLAIAWTEYTRLAGQTPHGTERQMAGLLSLATRAEKEAVSEERPRGYRIKRTITGRPLGFLKWEESGFNFVAEELSEIYSTEREARENLNALVSRYNLTRQFYLVVPAGGLESD